MPYGIGDDNTDKWNGSTTSIECLVIFMQWSIEGMDEVIVRRITGQFRSVTNKSVHIICELGYYVNSNYC